MLIFAARPFTQKNMVNKNGGCSTAGYASDLFCGMLVRTRSTTP